MSKRFRLELYRAIEHTPASQLCLSEVGSPGEVRLTRVGREKFKPLLNLCGLQHLPLQTRADIEQALNELHAHCLGEVMETGQ